MAIRKEAEETKLCNTAEGDLLRSNTLGTSFWLWDGERADPT